MNDQRSVNDQLDDLEKAAVEKGLYDAHDWVRARRQSEGSMALFRTLTTQKTPHGEIGPDGKNWICETSFGTSCWATLESCIERKLIVKACDGAHTVPRHTRSHT